MLVKDLMKTSVETILPTTPFRDVWKTIFKRKINALPVVDTKKKLLGLVARESMLELLYPDYKELFSFENELPDFEEMESKIQELGSLKAKDIMAKRLVYTHPETPVMQALSRMIVQGVNQLPVLTEEGKLTGVITKGDIFYGVFKTYMKHVSRQHDKKRK